VRDHRNFSYLDLASDQKLLRTRLKAIGAACETNALLRRLYPYMAPLKGSWELSSKTIVGRDPSAMEPTFECRTFGQPVAGRHKGLINVDDPTNEKNYRIRSKQEELIAGFDSLWPTLTSESDWMTTEFTLWADYDLGSHIIRTLYPDALDLYIQPVRGYAEVDDAGKVTIVDNGVYADPEHWDDVRFEATRRKFSDPAMFYAQYMLDLTPRGERSFQESWLRHQDRREWPQLTYVLIADPASGGGTSRPALVCMGMDAEGVIYLEDAEDAFRSVAEHCEGILAWYDKYKPLCLVIENYAGIGRATIEHVKELARKRGKWIVIREVRGAKKEQRIPDTLWPLYGWGRVIHAPEFRGSEYEAQLSRFRPEIAHNQRLDLIDAASYGPPVLQRMAGRGEKRKPGKEHPRGHTLEAMFEEELEDLAEFEDADPVRSGTRSYF